MDGKLSGLIGLHIDHFQGTGNDWFFKNVMDQICLKFEISKRERQVVQFTGVDEVGCDNGNVIISQDEYSQSLGEIKVDPKDDP